MNVQIELEDLELEDRKELYKEFWIELRDKDLIDKQFDNSNIDNLKWE